MADITITPSNVVPSSTATTIHLQPANTIVGEAINAGETVCLLAADGRYWKADANDTLKQNVKGIAGNSAVAAGQRIDIIQATPAMEVGAHGVAVGIPLYQSATPGKLCPYADLSSGALPVLMAFAATATALTIVIATALQPKP